MLANVKRAGESVFKTDFEGEDMMGKMLNSPKAAERREFKLFRRLLYRSRHLVHPFRGNSIFPGTEPSN